MTCSVRVVPDRVPDNGEKGPPGRNGIAFGVEGTHPDGHNNPTLPTEEAARADHAGGVASGV
jgi:hypothetical protein